MASICVYCSSSEAIDPRYLELAEAVGVRLAADGHSLVWGAGQVSMMGAVSQAARRGGAHTVGVIPQALVSFEEADAEADELIVVDTMRQRKQIMQERSDAVIALPGGIGTLEELFEMWTSASLFMHSMPVLVIDPEGFYAPMWTFLEGLVARGFVRDAAFDVLHRVGSVDEAFALLGALLTA